MFIDNVYVEIAASRELVELVFFVRQSLSCSLPGHQDTVISLFCTISRTLDISTRSLRSHEIFDVCICCTSELLSVMQLIGGNDGSPKTSFNIDAIRYPASAPSPRASVSDARGLLVTLCSFLDCQLIGTNFPFFPSTNTKNTPWEDPS